MSDFELLVKGADGHDRLILDPVEGGDVRDAVALFPRPSLVLSDVAVGAAPLPAKMIVVE